VSEKFVSKPVVRNEDGLDVQRVVQVANGGTSPYAFMACARKTYKPLENMPIACNILDVKAVTLYSSLVPSDSEHKAATSFILIST
jgi:hypothetical protein